jgi:hypothetical protein
MTQPQRSLLLLPKAFCIEHLPNGAEPTDDGWIAMVRAPEGLTVVGEIAEHDSRDAEQWAGFYGNDAHDLNTPGMLAAVIGPLALEGIAVFVTSTFRSDLVLVPYGQRARVTAVLEVSGHQVGTNCSNA